MFGFMKKKDDIVVLNQKLGRLLNELCCSEVADEKQRTESRVRLGLPCVLFLYSEAADPKCYALGATSDMSLHGLSMIVNEAMDLLDYIVVVGSKEKRLYIKSTCKRCTPSEFGTFVLGLEFSKLLSVNDYPGIVKATRLLESPSHLAPMPDPAAALTSNSYSMA